MANSLKNLSVSNKKTFNWKHPPHRVTFNAMIDNPAIGDERHFVKIHEVGSGRYVGTIDLIPGKTYEVLTYVHNNAAEECNDREQNFKGIATNTKLKVFLPSTIKKGEVAQIISTISARNSNPTSVRDEITVNSSQKNVILEYVIGSAIISQSNGAVKGRGFDHHEFFGNGSLLGYSSLNGALPGGPHYALTVSFRFTVVEKDQDDIFNIQKTVIPATNNNSDSLITKDLKTTSRQKFRRKS